MADPYGCIYIIYNISCKRIAFQPHAALYNRRASQKKTTDAGKTSYLADKTIHLPRYTTAVSRGRITREKAKRKARHKTPHQGQRSQLAAKCRKLQEKTTFLRRARAEAAAPRNKKRLSRPFYGGKGAFRHALQRAARLEMVAKMTGRTPKMRTNRLKQAQGQRLGNRRFPVTLSQTIL